MMQGAKLILTTRETELATAANSDFLPSCDAAGFYLHNAWD